MDNKKDEILKRRLRLSASQRELLEKRLRGEVYSYSQLEVIPKRSQTSPVLLSFAQQRLWFIHQIDPGNVSYNELGIIQLIGALQVVALEQSLNEIVRRHEALRTTFEMVEDQPVQVIHPIPTANVTITVVNLFKLPEAQRNTDIQRLIVEESQRTFDLIEGPLLRCTLLRVGEQEHILLFTIHHIVSDGWSIGVLVRELAALYEAFSTGKHSLLPELTIQYADFALWQRQWLQGEKLDTQLAYWKEQLANAKTVLELPTDRPRSHFQTSIGKKYYFSLSTTLSKSLKSLSQQEGVTLFMTLLAAFNTLLYRYTNQEDILIGSPIANRNRSEIEQLIGFFVNTLVLRSNLSNNPSFRYLLQRVKEVTLDAYTHQDLPFEKLVAELKLERNLNHTPLFQVWFVLQNTPTYNLELPGLKLSFLEVESVMVKHDLKLDLAETPEGIKGFFEYKTDLFDATTIARMAELFIKLLTIIVEQPDIKLKQLVSTLNEAEKEDEFLKHQNFQVARSQKLGKVKRKGIISTG
ncbi:MAG: condensation domain-containing protein [Nostoc sp.]|uniref:condensation domain-containing protein n=1 Tax=Nostoc sp. TaxID=1180 RepID=UPI002FFCFBBC